MQAPRIAVPLIALAALLASSADAAGPTLTVSQYRAKANAICASLNAYTPPNGTLAAQFGALLAKAHSSLRSLQRLEPPGALARTHQDVIVLISKGLGTFDTLLAQLRTGALTENRFRDKAGRVSSTREDALWRKLGAKVCAET